MHTKTKLPWWSLHASFNTHTGNINPPTNTLQLVGQGKPAAESDTQQPWTHLPAAQLDYRGHVAAQEARPPTARL